MSPASLPPLRNRPHHFSRGHQPHHARHKYRRSKPTLTIELQVTAGLRLGGARSIRPGKHRRFARPDAGYAHSRDPALCTGREMIVAAESFTHLPQKFIARFTDVARVNLRGVAATAGRAHRQYGEAALPTRRNQMRLV